MAKTPAKRKRGRPKGKVPKGKRIAFQLPAHHHEYLDFLVKKKKRFGKTVNQAALFLVQRDLDRMEQEGYHEKDFATD